MMRKTKVVGLFFLYVRCSLPALDVTINKLHVLVLLAVKNYLLGLGAATSCKSHHQYILLSARARSIKNSRFYTKLLMQIWNNGNQCTQICTVEATQGLCSK